MLRFICAILLAITCLANANNRAVEPQPRVACLDEQGNEVDWYIGYKFPKIKNTGDRRFETGYSYAYITNKDAGESQEAIKSEIEIPDKKDSDLSLFLYRFKDLLLRYAGSSKQEANKSSNVGKRKSSNKDGDDAHWSLSNLRITDRNSTLLRTLKPAYDERVNIILYNDDSGEVEVEDEPDDDTTSISSGVSGGRSPRKKRESNSNRAHAKGILMLDEERGNGVWVTHSIPRFPPRLNQPLEFPVSAQYYGQTFMCINFDLQKVGNNVVDHLRTMRPLVYDTRLSERMYQLLPNLRDLDTPKNLRDQKRRVSGKDRLVQIITTSGGQLLNLFSKSKAFSKDMWAGWIDEELGSALYVETWRRGAGSPLNSTCPPNEYHTNNVKDLKYDTKASWSFLNDHSKWAISDEKDSGYVCIGDVNRMESQFKRGGGAVCLKCPTCWTIFSNTILDVEPCPRGSRKKDKKITDADAGLIKRIARTFHLRDN